MRRTYFLVFSACFLAACASHLFAQSLTDSSSGNQSAQLLADSSLGKVSREDLELIEKLITEIRQSYYGKVPPDSVFVRSALQGIVDALGDRYSYLETKEDYFFDEREDEKGMIGIGTEKENEADYASITHVRTGGPADLAGLKKGDRIYKIDGEPVQGLSNPDIIRAIRGPGGTAVTLEVFNAGTLKTRNVSIRRKIFEEIVSWRTLEDSIVVIKIPSFTYANSLHFSKAVEDISKLGKVNRYIIDLRDNPGGYVSVAIAIASYWLPAETSFYFENNRKGDSIRKVWKGRGDKRFHGKKTVILINGGSASASEMFAAALRYHLGTALIGGKTGGKGSIQTASEFSGKYILKLTVGKWFTLEGKTVSGSGLTPDIEVALTGKDIAAKRDPQLKKAVEIVKQ